MTERSAAEAPHPETQAAFDRLYTRIAQRLEQNEALLDGLVALLRAVADRGYEHLRHYSTEILSRYPHIHTVGYQVRVEHAQRGEFEQRMSAVLGRQYLIRDYSIEGNRSWRVAPPRAFYYPATFMAPEVAGAQDVIGYDGYGDALFRAAIDRAGSDDRGVATLPFDLIEGGRGYVFLRAFDLDESKSARPGAHVVSLLVRADGLIDGEPMPAGARVELRRRGDDNSVQAVVAAARGATGDAATTTWLRRAVPSVRQPFRLLPRSAGSARAAPAVRRPRCQHRARVEPAAGRHGRLQPGSPAPARPFHRRGAGARGAASRHRTGVARQRVDSPLARSGAATHAAL